VEVGDKDSGQFVRGESGAHQLYLRRLAAIKEPPLAIPNHGE